jgi:hypothetical protein
MGIEAFPEIESFQKLPRQVIVKGGTSTFDEKQGATLRGIVINNIGSNIRDLRVNVVILDAKGIPVLSTSTSPEPQEVPQGGISSFSFHIEDYPEKISNYHLYADWKFDDRT